MSEQTVEKKVETAVATPTEEVTVNTSEVDYEAVLKQKDQEIEQVRKEKENYRKGMLKAKGKIPDDSSGDDEIENMEALIDRKVTERFLSTKEAQLQAEKDNALKAVLKRNKELEVALKSRGQILDTSASGANLDRPEVKTDTYFSKDQIQALKAKGWSDAKIEAAKKNMTAGNSMSPIIK